MTPRQKQILKAVAELQPDAYGVTLHGSTGIPLGHLYADLEAMESKYLIGVKDAPGGADRGYRPKRLYALTPVGRRALAVME